MQSTYPPVIFLVSNTESAIFWAADIALTSAQRKGTCELVTASDNLFTELYNRLDNSEFAERLLIFHWIGQSSDSTFIEQLIRRLSNLPNLVCLLLEDISVPPSATIAHLLPITIAIQQHEEQENFFSSHFYEQLAQHKSIREAYNHASSQTAHTSSTMFVRPSSEAMLEWSFERMTQKEPSPQRQLSPEEEAIARFRKIINQKAVFSAFSKPELLLSEKELALVDKFKHQLLPLSDIEQQLWLRSSYALEKKQRQRRYLYRTIFFLSFFLVLLGIAFWAQNREHQRELTAQKTQTKQQHANFLTYVAQSLQGEDATRAMRLVEQAVREYPTLSAQHTLYEHFYTPNLFYTARIDLTEEQNQFDKFVISPDGLWIFYIKDSTVFIRSQKGDVVQKLDRSNVKELAFSQTMPYRLALGFTDGKIEILDINGKSIASWQAHADTLNLLRFSNDDLHLLSSADTSVFRWKLSGEVQDTLAGNHADIIDISYSPNQSKLLTIAKDSVLAIWDTSEEDASLLSTLEGYDARWLNDTHLLICTSSQYLIWNIITNKFYKAFTKNTQITPQDDNSYWVVDSTKTLYRHYFKSDSVVLWSKNLSSFTTFEQKKWASINENGRGQIYLAGSTMLDFVLDDVPVKEPFFSQDGNFLITQTATFLTFWRAHARSYHFATPYQLEDWLLMQTPTPKRQVALVYFSGKIHRLIDKEEQVKAEWEAEQAQLHPTQNYVLTLKGSLISLDEFEKSETSPAYKITMLFSKKGSYRQMGFSQQGTFVWAITSNNQVELMDLQGNVFFSTPVKESATVVVSPNDNYIVLAQEIADFKNPYRIIHLQTKQSYELDTRLERGSIKTLFFSPDEEFLVSASNLWTDFWDMRGRRIKTLRGGNPVYGKNMILTSQNEYFHIASTQAQAIYSHQQEGLKSATLSPNKDYIILQTDSTSYQAWKTSIFGITEWLDNNQIYELSVEEKKQLQVK